MTDIAKEFEELDKNLANIVLAANEIKDEFDNEDYISDKQQTYNWFVSKLGVFSGSKLPKLMKGGRGKVEWGETAFDVIQLVALERDLSDEGIKLYVTEEMSKEFRETNWGNKYESEARDEYCAKCGDDVIVGGFLRSSILPAFGCSTDGKRASIDRIIEIKCPYNVAKHQANVILDSIDEDHEYYAQMQGNMMAVGVDTLDFISYDPRRKTNKLKVITVEANKEYQARLLKRLIVAEEAVRLINKLNVDPETAVYAAEKKYANGEIG